MITGQLACRIFYVYYLAMAYMWLAKPADMLENFDYIETDNATALNVGRWMGSAFAILSCVFMAAAQLEFAAQKKILQYQTVGLVTCVYMAQQGRELVKDTAPMDKNFGLYLCCVLTFLSIYPCYWGPDAKSKSD